MLAGGTSTTPPEVSALHPNPLGHCHKGEGSYVGTSCRCGLSFKSSIFLHRHGWVLDVKVHPCGGIDLVVAVGRCRVCSPPAVRTPGRPLPIVVVVRRYTLFPTS